MVRTEETLPFANQLIIAADFPVEEETLKWLLENKLQMNPTEFQEKRQEIIEDIYSQLIKLAECLQGTGVIIKLNSILRVLGYQIIDTLKDLGLKVMADLKLNDIPNTMKADAKLLSLFEPNFVTIMCSAGLEGMKAVREVFEDSETQVIGVTVLTSMIEADCISTYGEDLETTSLKFASWAQKERLHGIVCSAQTAKILQTELPSLNLTINCPGIRPEWYEASSDDQKQTATPTEALQAGAYRLIIGRPVTLADAPLDAVNSLRNEIAYSGINQI